MVKKVIPRYLPSKIFRPIGSLRNLIFRLRFFSGNGLRSETGVLHRETIHIGDVELMFIKKSRQKSKWVPEPSENAEKSSEVAGTGGKELKPYGVGVPLFMGPLCSPLPSMLRTNTAD